MEHHMYQTKVEEDISELERVITIGRRKVRELQRELNIEKGKVIKLCNEKTQMKKYLTVNLEEAE